MYSMIMRLRLLIAMITPNISLETSADPDDADAILPQKEPSTVSKLGGQLSSITLLPNYARWVECTEVCV